MRGCGDHTPCERSESEQSCEASGAEHFAGWGVSQWPKLGLYVVKLSAKYTKEGQPHYQWAGSKSANEVNGRQWAVHVRVFFPDDGCARVDAVQLLEGLSLLPGKRPIEMTPVVGRRMCFNFWSSDWLWPEVERS